MVILYAILEKAVNFLFIAIIGQRFIKTNSYMYLIKRSSCIPTFYEHEYQQVLLYFDLIYSKTLTPKIKY